MLRLACKSAAEVSCTISNLIAELEQPCEQCEGESVVLTGVSPTGEHVTVRLLSDRVLEVEGGDGLLEDIRRRGCPFG